jgi:hypothetical protein
LEVVDVPQFVVLSHPVVTLSHTLVDLVRVECRERHLSSVRSDNVCALFHINDFIVHVKRTTCVRVQKGG